MTDRRAGFTIVEVLIAVVMLSVGLLVLAGGAGGVTRMMLDGQRKTRSIGAATSLLEGFRNTANTNCGALGASGSSTSPGGISATWTISNSGSTGTNHLVTIVTSYQVGTRTLGDRLITTLYC